MGDVIRKWKLKGIDIARVQEDILEFHSGQESRLENYLLAEGRDAERGEDCLVEWTISFLPEKRVAELKNQLGSRSQQLAEFISL